MAEENNASTPKKETAEEVRRRQIQERLATIKQKADQSRSGVSKPITSTEKTTTSPAPEPTPAPVTSAPNEKKEETAPVKKEEPVPVKKEESVKKEIPPSKNAEPVKAAVDRAKARQMAAKEAAKRKHMKKAPKQVPTETVKGEGEKKSRKGVYIGAAVVVVVLAVASWLYFDRSSRDKAMQMVGLEESSETTTTDNSDLTADMTDVGESESEDAPNMGETDNADVEDMGGPDAGNDADLAEKEEDEQEPVPVKRTSSVNDAGGTDKWGLKRPSFIIGYFATGKEETAKAQVQELKSFGFEGGYYWKPDYKQNDKPLFKVYVGPFNTRQESEKMLATVKKVRPDAHISKIN